MVKYFTKNISPCLIPAIKVTQYIFCIEYHINNVAAGYREMLGNSCWGYVQVHWFSIQVCKLIALLHY